MPYSRVIRHSSSTSAATLLGAGVFPALRYSLLGATDSTAVKPTHAVKDSTETNI